MDDENKDIESSETREEKNKSTRKEIEFDIQKEKIKKIVIHFFKIIVIVVSFFILFFLWTKYISTNNIMVKEKRIISNKIPTNFDGIKIIHFSDILYGSNIKLNELKNIRKIINKRNPDLIIYNGNLLDKKYKISNEEEKKLINELSKIKSTIGKYSLISDNDSDEVKTILKESGFNYIENNNEYIYLKGINPIMLTFLNDNIETSFKYYEIPESNKNIYNIVILQNPDDIENIDSNYYDLALSGKSLNGQICITKNLCFKKFSGAKKYYKEYYKKNNKDFYISSGLGTPNNEIRFMARPSINFFRLSSK